MPKVAEELEVRYVEFANDAADVLVIENKTYDEDSRWQAIDFKAAMRDGCEMLVVLVDDLVVGYVVYKISDTHANILNLTVHPRYRRQGFGSLLLSSVRVKGCGRLRMEVRDTSLEVHLFMKSHDIKAKRIARRADGDWYVFEE